MKNTPYIILILLLISINSFSQNNTAANIGDYNNVIPPNPNASAVNNLATSEPDLSSGALMVNVPIYTFTERELSIPINLSYRGSGYKVDDIASNVGLGWSMSGQWMITRTIMHRDDNDGTFGYRNHNLDPSTITNSSDQFLEEYDCQPDQYSYNFAGYSGKFYVRKDGSIFKDDKNDLQIIESPGTWTIIDGRGNKYTFALTEMSTNTLSSNGIYSGITGWYITEVELNHGHKITFSYSSSPISYINSRSFSFVKQYNCEGPCDNGHVSGSNYSDSYTTSATANHYLTSINGQYSSVEFTYGDREDEGVKLDKISVLKNGILEKYFDFTYNYFTSNNYSRLKLKSIQEFGHDGSSIPPYQFYYLDENSSNYKLPDRLSNSQDHWGYFNLANNQSLLPFDKNDPDTWSHIWFGDRNPNETGSKAGMLNRMETPYGGFKNYEYEAHDYNYINTDQTLTPNYVVNQNSFRECQGCSGCNLPVGNYQYGINIDFTQYVNFQWKMINTSTPGDDAGEIKILNSSGSLVHEFSQPNPTNYNSWQDIDILLTPGAYTIVMNNLNFPVCQDLLFNYESYARDAQGNLISTSFPCGGVRIKSISDNDGTVSFSYLDDDNYLSSGIIAAIPNYQTNYKTTFKCNPTGGTSGYNCGSVCQTKVISSSNTTSANTTNGSHIYYKKVTKHYEKHGRTEYKFSFIADQINNTFPSGKNTTREYGRGHLESQKDFNKANSLVREINNEYTIHSTGNLIEDELDGFVIAYNPVSPICPNAEVAVRWYKIESRWIRLDKTTEKTWGTDGSGPFISITDNSYYEHNYQPNQVTVSSGFNSRTTKYKYAYEMGNSSLMQKNIVSYPLEVLIDNGAGGGYKVDLWNNNTTLPYKVYDAQDNGHFKWRTLYAAYTPDNYPLSVRSRLENKSNIFTWSNGLMTKRKYQQRSWNYEYDNFRRLKKVIDFNNIQSEFEYDDLGRLSISKSNSNDIVSNFNYRYGTIANPINIVTTSTSYPGDPFNTPDQVTEISYDPFGRQIEEKRVGYTQSGNDFSLSWSYDQLNNKLTDCHPEKGGCDEFMIEKSPLSRILQIKRAGYVGQQTIKHIHTANDITQHITDEDGRVSSSSTDVFGRQIKKMFANAITSYTYNQRDQVTNIIPSNGPGYSYEYYNNGLLRKKTIPHYGSTSYWYHATDQLKKEQLPTGETLEYNYDGIYNDFLKSVRRNGQNIKQYSMFGISGQPASETLATYTGTNHVGSISNSFTYDNLLRVIGMTESYGTGVSTFEYDLDNLGNIQSMDRNHTGPTGQIFISKDFDFDKGIRLESVTGTYPQIGQVKVIDEQVYNDNDWMTQQVLGNKVQTVDFGYKANGNLKNINGLGETQCPERDTFDLECIGPLTSYELLFDCLALENGNPTDIIINIIEYDENGNPSLVQITMPVNGGSAAPGGSSPTGGQNIPVNPGVNPQTIMDGLSELLLDCIGENFPDDVISGLQQFEIKLSTGKILSGDMFAMELHYEDGEPDLSAPGQKAGNISWIEWQNQLEPIQKYGFTYDNFSRLSASSYKAEWDCQDVSSLNYSTNVSYADALGNISNLMRYGFKEYDDAGKRVYDLIDDLAYSYNNTNILASVTESGFEEKGFKGSYSGYGYDNVGRLISDSGKGITNIHYNFLSVPLKITTNQGIIENTYDANGRKLSSSNGIEGYEMELHNGIEYRNGEIESIFHEAGRITFFSHVDTATQEVCNWPYNEIYLKDHLGNIRNRVADKNQDGLFLWDPSDPCGNEVFGSNHYYPFGMETEGPWVQHEGTDNNYRYNGKEDVKGLGWLDFGFRYYNPSVGRFTGVDPLAEQYAFVTPYNYAENSPVRYIDLWGLQKFDLMGIHDPVAKQSFELGGIKQLKSDRASFQEGMEKGLNIAADLILDEIPIIGELKALAEGGVPEMMIGMAPFGRKIKKLGKLADDVPVVRGGSNTPARFDAGTGVHSRLSDKKLDGISVNSKDGKTVTELSEGIPHNKVGVTTVGEIRKAGGDVIPSPTKGNPNHATMSIPDSKTASDLMHVIKNPKK